MPNTKATKDEKYKTDKQLEEATKNKNYKRKQYFLDTVTNIINAGVYCLALLVLVITIYLLMKDIDRLIFFMGRAIEYVLVAISALFLDKEIKKI